MDFKNLFFFTIQKNTSKIPLGVFHLFVCILYFIFLTNIEKLTYFLIHFLDIFKFLKYFLKFSRSSKNFSEISCIYKYMKSCICPLGLHYEIPECAYLSPRGIASKIQKCNQKHFYQIFLNSNPARNQSNWRPRLYLINFQYGIIQIE